MRSLKGKSWYPKHSKTVSDHLPCWTWSRRNVGTTCCPLSWRQSNGTRFFHTESHPYPKIPSSCIFIHPHTSEYILTGLPSPGIMVSKGNHPQMAQQFRLVKYYNLPIYIYISSSLISLPPMPKDWWSGATQLGIRESTIGLHHGIVTAKGMWVLTQLWIGSAIYKGLSHQTDYHLLG